MIIECQNCGSKWQREFEEDPNIAVELVECFLCFKMEEEGDVDNEEEELKNSVQRIKPIMIDPKIKRMAETPPGKRFRRTKAEMETAGEQTKEKSVLKQRTKLFPEEINDFIKKNWEDKRDVDLVEMIEEKFGKEYKIDQIKANRRTIGCVANRSGAKGKKKLGKPKIYTDEVVQFLKDNINNLSNKELCKELGMKFNIKTNTNALQMALYKNKIKRESKSTVHQVIVDFIRQSKQTDVYMLRDEIIEKFETNLKIFEIKNIMDNQEERVEEQEDDFLDELELGD